jgi:uncharacterized membrane protein YgcG
MPQGGDGGSKKRPRSLVPEKATYSRKADSTEVKRGGPLNHTINPTFAAALPGMIRNIELIAAGKAMQSGIGLHTHDMKSAGAIEMKSIKLKRVKGANKGATEVAKIVNRGRNAKGIRGKFDIDELAALQPDLKKVVNKRQLDGDYDDVKKGSEVSNRDETKRLNGARLGSGESKSSTGRGSSSGGGGGGGGGVGGVGVGGGGGGKTNRIKSLTVGVASGSQSVVDVRGIFSSDADVAGAFGKEFL